MGMVVGWWLLVDILLPYNNLPYIIPLITLNRNKIMYKNYTKIDKVLSQTAKQYKLEGALHRYEALKYWEEVVTSYILEAKELTKAVDFRKGVLTVACLSKEISYQIKLLSQRIIYALNQLLGKNLVFAIKIEA
jgi:hypothetical protein